MQTAPGRPDGGVAGDHPGAGRRAGAPLVLALLSGVPALVYEVVWTREVGLLVGSQIEGISIVLAAFFGGLALGAHRLGARADRVRSPLRLYAGLEAGGAVLAAASLALLRWVGREGAALPEWALLAVAALAIAPATFLLGGTLPALLRSAAPDAVAASRMAGAVVGANTAGAVLGVALAAWSAPRLGLAATLYASSLGAAGLGAAAAWLGAREPERRATPASARTQAAPASRAVLAAAALAGAATLSFEALAARAAALRLGSSLLAWAWVLALVLAGLALGNSASARRAGRSDAPGRDLGWIETGASAAIALALLALRSAPATPAAGLSPAALVSVGAAVLAPCLLMGAAFPFFVRLAVRETAAVGRVFGRVSAANTAGGIAGALLGPLVLLPQLGLDGGIAACAGGNALLGAAYLYSPGARGGLRPVVALLSALAALWPLLAGFPDTGGERRLLFVRDGRQATAAVVRVHGRRDLYVDGDPEASTAGDARRTEQLLAALPLRLHPDPRRLLEVGLGSGITLGTAAGFPLEHIDCVEISQAVIRAAGFFAPQNGDVARGGDPRIRILHADGRALLARAPEGYDVIVANTVHPWSVGATGLYSREYFQRMAGALRGGGLAVQWLPLERIGARDLAAVLRTFFAVFAEGGVYWGADSLIAVGAERPLPAARPHGRTPDPVPEQVASPSSLWVASARGVREVVGPGILLRDDVPRLEARAAAARREGGPDDELELVEHLAAAGTAERPATGPLWLWLQSLGARRRGDPERADRLEQLAEEAGLALARHSRADRLARRGSAALGAGRLAEAEEAFRASLEAEPRHAKALRGTAVLAHQRGDEARAREILERLLAEHPEDAEAWNLLASLTVRDDPAAAGRALERALHWDPFFPEALANAGLLAVRRGDLDRARRMLGRLAELSPRQDLREERALREALASR